MATRAKRGKDQLEEWDPHAVTKDLLHSTGNWILCNDIWDKKLKKRGCMYRLLYT